MSDGTKINYCTEFPRIGRVLVIEATAGEVATIRIINSVNGEMVCMKKFEDYNEAMRYYSEKFSNFEMAEEYEKMLCAFKMFGYM